MNLCPCGSQKSYSDCCAWFIDGNQAAPTPERLMRSRYTAYSLARMDYIQKTMRGKALQGFDEQAAERWAKKLVWLRLEIMDTSMATEDKGFVEFKASYVQKDRLHDLQEVSEFHRENGIWYYVDGELKSQQPGKQLVLRNTLCPCGSQKKFKNCHAKPQD